MTKTRFDKAAFSLDDLIDMIITAHQLGVSLDKGTREEVIASLKKILTLLEYEQ